MNPSNPEETPPRTPGQSPHVLGHPPCAYLVRMLAQVAPQELRTTLASPPDDLAWEATPEQAAAEVLEELPYVAPALDPRSRELRAYESHLRCGECVMHTLCPLEMELAARIEAQEHIRLLTMFADSPNWLAVARLRAAHMDVRDLARLANDAAAAAGTLQQGFSFETLIGDVRNKPVKPLTVEQLPRQLAGCLAGVHPFATFETSLITVDGSAYDFTVGEMPAGIYTGPRPSGKDYAALAARFLDALHPPGPGERPTILNLAQQRTARRFDGGYIAEIRAGRARLYAAVLQPPGGRDTEDMSCAVLLIGAHGPGGQELFYGQTGLARLH